jgi:hypothetical protein
LNDRVALARSEDLVVEELDQELLVYDLAANRAHCLSATAARVWRACDGFTTTEVLCNKLDLDEETLTQALQELDSCALLQAHELGTTRREMTVKVAKYGTAVAAAPLVVSILAPVASATATPTPFQCELYTTTACGASTGCGSIAGCCCCSKGCKGETSCKGCTSVKACTGGNQLCAKPNPVGETAGTGCSDAKGTNPAQPGGCCGFVTFTQPGNVPVIPGGCGCGWGSGGGCCDSTSTTASPVPCTSAATCVPCCNNQPIKSGSMFGCCNSPSQAPGGAACVT